MKETVKGRIPDITNLATNTTLSSKIDEVKSEIPSITNLATTTTALNAKINEAKQGITNINNLATATALAAVGNRMPNVGNVVKETNYNTKISENEKKTNIDHDHDKYITTQEFKKLTSKCFTTGLEQTNWASKNDIANLAKQQILIINLKLLYQRKLEKKIKAISTKGLT